MVRAVTEARDTQSGSSPSASRVARRSKSPISSTAGSSGEEERQTEWTGRWGSAGLSPRASASGRLTVKFKVCLVVFAKNVMACISTVFPTESGSLILIDFNYIWSCFLNFT